MEELYLTSFKMDPQKETFVCPNNICSILRTDLLSNMRKSIVRYKENNQNASIKEPPTLDHVLQPMWECTGFHGIAMLIQVTDINNQYMCGISNISNIKKQRELGAKGYL